MAIIYAFLMFSLLLPLADVAIAGFRFISAWQALRAFGQSIQYSPPPDVTDTSNWATTAKAKADPAYPISNLQVMCDTTVCTSINVATAATKSYSYSTSITLAPMIVNALCPGGTCTFTLQNTVRFQ